LFFQGRMSSHVFPGDSLTTSMWAVPPRPGAPAGWGRVVFQVVAVSEGESQERIVISGGAVEVVAAVEGEGRARL